MIVLDIPGFGRVEIEHLVTDFTGTLSEDGLLLEGVRERLQALSEKVKIHILTADTFGTAKKQLEGLNCNVHILDGDGHDMKKAEYVEKLNPEKVFAMGNGNNDRMMLKKAKIGVAVCLREGCAVDALQSADILVRSPLDGLDLLLKPKRLKATLRF